MTRLHLPRQCLRNCLLWIENAMGDTGMASDPDLASDVADLYAFLTATELVISARLTPRERHVLVYVAQGYSDKQIARKLCMSHKTVRGHVYKVITKLGVTNRTQAARWAWRTGLVDPDEAWCVVDAMRRNTPKEGRQL